MKFLAEVVNFGGGVVDNKTFENDTWTGAKRTASAFRDGVEMHSTPQRVEVVGVPLQHIVSG